MKIVSDQEDEQRRRVEQWRAEVDAIVGKLARYDFLRNLARPELAARLNVERMGSLDEAHTVVSALFRARGESERRKALDLVRFAIDNQIPGDHAHNMAAELARHNYPKLALAILEEGMRRFPGSPDLVGSAMQHAVGNGEMDKAGEYFSGLLKLDNAVWNWRAFTGLSSVRQISGQKREVQRCAVNCARKAHPVPKSTRCSSGPDWRKIKILS